MESIEPEAGEWQGPSKIGLKSCHLNCLRHEAHHSQVAKLVFGLPRCKEAEADRERRVALREECVKLCRFEGAAYGQGAAPNRKKNHHASSRHAGAINAYCCCRCSCLAVVVVFLCFIIDSWWCCCCCWSCFSWLLWLVLVALVLVLAVFHYCCFGDGGWADVCGGCCCGCWPQRRRRPLLPHLHSVFGAEVVVVVPTFIYFRFTLVAINLGSL